MLTKHENIPLSSAYGLSFLSKRNAHYDQRQTSALVPQKGLSPYVKLTRSTSGIGRLGYWLSDGILVVEDRCRVDDQYRAKESYGGSRVKVEGCQNEKTDMARRVLTDLGIPRADAAH